MRSDLRAFRVAADFPVIFVDVRPFTHPADYPPRSAFAGSDQAAIGAIAADWSVDYLSQNRRKRPLVLVVAGVAQGERQQQFVTVVQDTRKMAEVAVSLLIKAMNGEPVPTEMLIPLDIYPRS